MNTPEPPEAGDRSHTAERHLRRVRLWSGVTLAVGVTGLFLLMALTSDTSSIASIIVFLCGLALLIPYMLPVMRLDVVSDGFALHAVVGSATLWVGLLCLAIVLPANGGPFILVFAWWSPAIPFVLLLALAQVVILVEGVRALRAGPSDVRARDGGTVTPSDGRGLDGVMVPLVAFALVVLAGMVAQSVERQERSRQSAQFWETRREESRASALASLPGLSPAWSVLAVGANETSPNGIRIVASGLPAPMILADSLVLVATPAGIALVAPGGRMTWSAPLGVSAPSIPVRHGDTIWLGGVDGRLHRLILDGEAPPRLEAERPLGAPLIGRPLFLDNGDVLAGTLNRGVGRVAADGQVRWLYSDAYITNGPALVAGERVIVAGRQSTAALDLDGNRLWRSDDVGWWGMPDTPPAVWGDAVVLRGNRGLVFVEPDGIRERVPLGYGDVHGPVAGATELYVTAGRAVLALDAALRLRWMLDFTERSPHVGHDPIPIAADSFGVLLRDAEERLIAIDGGAITFVTPPFGDSALAASVTRTAPDRAYIVRQTLSGWRLELWTRGGRSTGETPWRLPPAPER